MICVQKYLSLDVESDSSSSGSGSGSGSSCDTETSFVPASQTSDERSGGQYDVPRVPVVEVARHHQPPPPPPPLPLPLGDEDLPHPSRRQLSSAYDDRSQLLLTPIDE